jgi:hypothetical protein
MTFFTFFQLTYINSKILSIFETILNYPSYYLIGEVPKGIDNEN